MEQLSPEDNQPPVELSPDYPFLVVRQRDDETDMFIGWPEGADLSAFASVLSHLQNGNLNDLIKIVATKYGENIDDAEAADEFIEEFEEGNKIVHAESMSESVIPPLMAMSRLINYGNGSEIEF